jgi:hypothetical protein
MTGLESAIKYQNKYGFSLGIVTEKETGLFVGRAGLIYFAYDGHAARYRSWLCTHQKCLAQRLCD